MTPRQIADAIAASVRASLQQVVESGQPLDEALELGIDRAIGNNAAQSIALQMEES